MRRSPLARPVTAFVAAALVSGALVGCSGFSINGGCVPEINAGDASSTVVASGGLGDSPAVEFPTPLISDAPQLSVLETGEGDPIGRYAAVDTQFTLFDAATGDVLQATPYDGTSTAVRFTAGETAGVVGDALLCATPGTRLALTAPVEMFSEDFDPEADLSGDTYLLVIDVLRDWIGKANGVNQLPLDGMPAVATAVNGEPGVAVSTQVPATEPRSATIKAGAGEAITEGDTAVIHMRNWSWSATGTVELGTIDTWAKEPAGLVVDPDTTDDTLPTDVYTALIGAKVGSQLLIVNPADGGGATIFVVDILGIDHDAE